MCIFVKNVYILSKEVHEGYREFNHYCYISPIRENIAEKQKNKKALFIFYDFETRQDENVPGDSTSVKHIPTLCVAQITCTDCLHNSNISDDCNTCGVSELIFKNEPIKELVELAVRNSTNFSRIICIAHNSKGFDAQFILQYLVNKMHYDPPSLILNGTKIMRMKIGRTTFIDSLNYFQMPLSALPKAFDLPDVEKVTFPHLFNTIDNQSYTGSLPDLHYYSPDAMFDENRKKFWKWYEETKNSGNNFDFQTAMTNIVKWMLVY